MAEFDKLPSYMRMELEFAQICQQIGQNGIQLDIQSCFGLISQLELELEDISKQLAPKIPPVVKIKEKILVKIYKKDGSPTKKMTDAIGSGDPYKIEGNGEAAILRVWSTTTSVPNLNNSEHLRDLLLKQGWQPLNQISSWNLQMEWGPFGRKVKSTRLDPKHNKKCYIRTTPKLPKEEWELDYLDRIHESEDFRLISKYQKRKHRLGVLKGFVKNIRADGRIKMGINSCSCNSMRVTHHIVANLPRVETYFGKDIRGVMTTPQGKVLVGCDMSGLELRILAHYINDPTFTDSIINGDIHTYLYENLFKDLVKSRSSSKNLTYAFLYGGGLVKLGTMCDNVGKQGDLAKLGKEVKKRFLTRIPNLGNLYKDLEKQFTETGGIIGIDGRFIPCRYKHVLLNTLCQSGGAITSKYWTCLASRKLSESDSIVIYYHDENQVETLDESACIVQKILIDSIGLAGKYLKLNIPLTGEAKIGKTWADTH